MLGAPPRLPGLPAVVSWPQSSWHPVNCAVCALTHSLRQADLPAMTARLAKKRKAQFQETGGVREVSGPD